MTQNEDSFQSSKVVMKLQHKENSSTFSDNRKAQ
jgi:hypothetical protein